MIVSPGQNEIEQMKKLGLDIVPHRKRMNESQPGLDEKFKDPDDPLRLVFVCAMWLTGFDAPSCSTVYLDKPMRNHTLMQTIARANRVFPGKHSGMIVDYANVFASLEKALAIYGAGKGGAKPGQGQGAAGRGAARGGRRRPRRSARATGWIWRRSRRCRWAGWSGWPPSENAVNALIAPDAVRREFLGHEQLVGHALPRREARPGGARVRAARGGHRHAGRGDPGQAQPRTRPTSRPSWARSPGCSTSRSPGLTIREAGPPAIDLSKINFEALAQRFKDSKHKNTDLEALKAAIRAQAGAARAAEPHPRRLRARSSRR